MGTIPCLYKIIKKHVNHVNRFFHDFLMIFVIIYFIRKGSIILCCIYSLAEKQFFVYA